MAEYGVNIKVGVQGQQSINSLAAQIKKITENLDAADKAFGRFQSKLKSFDQRREERKVNDELERRNEIYAATERAQRQLLANDNSRIKALERQAKIQDFISKKVSAGRMREQARRAQFLAGDPGAYATAIGPQEDRVAQIRQRNNQRQIAALVEQNKLSAKAVFNKNLEFAVTRKILGGDLKRNRLAEKITALQQRMIRNQQSLAKQKERALAADEKSAKLANLESQRRRRGALSSGLIGGAFPLLFGQGLGASAGGAVGGIAGGLAGGQLGFGLSLIGTTLGAAVDNFVSKIGDLASSLDDPAASLEALNEAGIKVSESVELQVESLLKAGRAYEAQELVLQQISDTLGPQAIGQLVAYDEETRELQSTFEEVSASIQREMLPALVGFLGLINDIVNVAKKLPIKEGLQTSLFTSPLTAPFAFMGQALSAAGGKRGQQAGRPPLSLKGQRLQEQATARSKSSRIALEIEQESAKIAGVRNNLLDESVYTARKDLIIAQERKRFQDLIVKGENTGLNIRISEARRDRELADLKASRNKQRDRELDRANAKSARLAKQEEKRLERSKKTGAALILQLERDVALQKARTPLERQLLEIAFAKEASQVRINELLDAGQETTARKLLDEKTELEVIKAQVEARLKLADLAGVDLGDTRFFGGDAGKAPGFATGFGLDLMDKAKQEKEVLDEFLKKYKQIGEAAQLAGELVTFGFRDMIKGAKSAEQVFADFLNSISDMLLKTAAQMIAQYIALGVARMFATGSTVGADILSKGPLGFNGGGIFTQPFKNEPVFEGVSSIFGTRANGGAVSGNRPYLVGERGPELFVPGAQGNIVSNDAMGGANVTVNVDASGSQVQGDGNNASQLGKAIGAAVQAELIKQQRPGGLLAR